MPIKAKRPPSLVMATATLAGAPPGALMNLSDSSSNTPTTSGMKSIKARKGEGRGREVYIGAEREGGGLYRRGNRGEMAGPSQTKGEPEHGPKAE